MKVIHPEKKQAIMAEAHKMGMPTTVKPLEVLARQHGVSAFTIRNWINAERAKRSSRPVSAPPPRQQPSYSPRFKESRNPESRASCCDTLRLRRCSLPSSLKEWRIGKSKTAQPRQAAGRG